MKTTSKTFTMTISVPESIEDTYPNFACNYDNPEHFIRVLCKEMKDTGKEMGYKVLITPQ